MINTILDLYNKTLNKQYKDFVGCGNKADKVVGKFLHITPYDIGEVANLKPQISKCETTIGNKSVNYEQEILYFSDEISSCLLLAPEYIWKKSQVVFIYQTIYDEVGYVSHLKYEILVFHKTLCRKIGFIDNSQYEIYSAVRERNFKLDNLYDSSLATTEYLSFVKDKISLYQ